MSNLANSDLWMRRCSIIVVTKTGKNSIDVSRLHCTFEVEKAVDEEPNNSTVVIYNLSATTEANIVNNGKKVIIEAGYQNGAYGIIYTGEIVQFIKSRSDAVSYALTLVCQDGDQFLNSAFVSQTLAAGSTQNDIILAATKDLIETGIITELNKAKLPRAKVIFGLAAAVMNAIAKAQSAQMYVEDGKVNIVAAKDYASSEAVELNPQTGLINAPEQTDDGVSCQCLINPRIKLNTRVHVNATLVQAQQISSDSKKAKDVSTDGVYRVIKMSISGDTRGNDWYMKLDCITQSGLKPTGLTGSSNRVWR